MNALLRRWFRKAPRLLAVEVARGAQPVARLSLEVADTMFRRAKGLMGRQRLEGEGMLFVYPWPRVVRIWMADTRLALDVVYIDPQGAIVKIAPGLAPMSRQWVSSEVAVKWVLEIAAGQARALDLKVGDRFRIAA